MKLLHHEKILGIATLVFIAVALTVSFLSGFGISVVETPDTNATPYKININTASAEELDSLDTITPSLAREIIRRREEHGPFKRTRELCRIPGIDLADFHAIENNIEV